MKKYLLLLLASVSLLTLPALALDPHDTQSTQVLAVNNVSTTTPQTFTIATLTTHAVNSGTNSYIYTADITYDTSLGSEVTLQIAQAGTAVTASQKPISGSGHVTIHGTAEAVAGSTAITIQAVVANTGVPIKIARATLVIVGLAGATQ